MTKYFYLRSQKGQISNKSININENGFLYIVTGKGYVQECLFSIKSLKNTTLKKYVYFQKKNIETCLKRIVTISSA